MPGVVVVNPVSVADGYGGLIDSTEGRLHVGFPSVVSTLNSSNTPLVANDAFEGQPEEVKDFATITVSVYSSHPSATDGLRVEFSTDATNWDGYNIFTVPSGKGKFFTFAPESRYLRVIYENSTQDQSEFRLQTIYHYTRTKPSSHRIQDSIVSDDDAELVKSILSGKGPNGNFLNVPVGKDGSLRVISSFGAPTEGTETGLISGEVASGGPNTVAIRKTAYNEPTAEAQRSIASSSANDTSAGTGARTVRITYLDSSLTGKKTEDIALNGTTGVNTSNSDIHYIEKVEVLTAGSNESNVGTITLYGSTNKTGGIVGTIAAGDNLTFWAHHYIDSDKTFFLVSLVGGIGIKEPGLMYGKVKKLDITDSVHKIVTSKVVLAAPTAGSSFASTFGTPAAIITGPATFTLFIDASASETYYAGFSYVER